MRRGVLVLAAGLAFWVAARLAGSPGLHMVGVGLVLLPLFAVIAGRRNRGLLRVERRLSSRRVSAGEQVTISLRVENDASATTPFLLLEDRLPGSLGPPAHLVLAGIPGHNHQTVSYTLAPAMRGVYSIGPASIDVTDPFALTRQRVILHGADELIVTPVVEELARAPGSLASSGGGESASRTLFRTGEEFYTIREYQRGDDLRRIHWPSVARTGTLMIRQDETARRAAATLLIDTRRTSLGPAGSPAFEQAMSAAASLGVLLLRSGFSLDTVTPERMPLRTTEGSLLEDLARVRPSDRRSLGSDALRLRADPSTMLAVVTAIPSPTEVASLSRTGRAFGRALAVLVHTADPANLGEEEARSVSDRASVARGSLVRAGWEVLVIAPGRPLADLWSRRNRRPVLSAR